jgi:NADH-quinone oxidoreductase subunit E
MQCCCGEENKLENRFPDTEVDLKPLDEVLKEYKGIEGSLITILQKTQEIYGYLPRRALQHIADVIGVKPAKILGAATFYTQFRFQPIGKYLIMLCQGTACHVNGSEKIEDGETTEDRLFTLENVACLGCCSLAPVMMINGEAYGKLTPESARKVIREIYKKETNS